MSKYQFSKLEKKCEVEVKMGEMTRRPKLASFWESATAFEKLYQKVV